MNRSKSDQPKAGNSNMVCSVFACNNTPTNAKLKGLKVSFYQLPNVEKWGQKRKQIWIDFCKRINRDGSVWVPSKNAKICSVHFIGGEVSSHPHSPSFNPSIRPDELEDEVRKEKDQRKVARFQRAKKRASTINPRGILQNTQNTKTRRTNKKKNSNDNGTIEESNSASNSEQNFESNFDSDDSNSILLYRQILQEDKCTQTESELNLQNVSAKLLTFTCHVISSTDKSTQVECKETVIDTQVASIPETQNPSPNAHAPSLVNQESNIVDNARLLNLTGINRNRFDFLLKLIEDSGIVQRATTFDQKLLMTLMRVKLGTSYTEVAESFCVNRSTVKRTFEAILDLLYNRTQSMIEWFEESVILPETANAHKSAHAHQTTHAHPRVILDSLEVKTEKSTLSNQRNPLNSTLKWLLGFSPNGTVTFLSKPYPGGSTNSFIINDSGLLRMLKPKDLVMVMDHDLLPVLEESASKDLITILPYEKQNPSPSSRTIQLIRQFDILNRPIPTELNPQMYKVMHLCCILANLDNQIIKE